MNHLTQAIDTLKTWHQVNLYDNSSKEPKGKLYEQVCASINPSELEKEIELQGGLTPSQLRLLTLVFDRYAKEVSKEFGRHFACSSSALITVDSFSHPDEELLKSIEPLTHLSEITKKESAPGVYDKAILTHIRADNGKLALTGGGFVDQNETCLEAIKREVHEETGEGCDLKSPTLVGIWDTRRGGPEHRISVMYTGIISGMPKVNHEAKQFYFVREVDIQNLPEPLVFGSHHKMMKRYYEEKGVMSFIGQNDKIDPQKKLLIEQNYQKKQTGYVSKYVESALDKVSDLYLYHRIAFSTWLPYKVCCNSELTESRNAIKGWITPNFKVTAPTSESQTWNEDKELWNFLEAFKTCAVKISNMFKTHITTGECGVIGMTMLMEKTGQERQYVVLNSKGKLHLPFCEHRHGESFKETLYREGLEQLNVRIDEDKIDLVEMQEDPNDKNELENPIRRFIFKVITSDEPKASNYGSVALLVSGETSKGILKATIPSKI